MNTNKDIEKLFKEQFKAFRPEPSKELWTKLSRQLKWNNFIHPRWGSFNIAYLSTIILGTAITAIILFDNNEIPELKENEDLTNRIENTNFESNQTTEVPGIDDQSIISKSSTKKPILGPGFINQNTESENSTQKVSPESTNEEKENSIDIQKTTSGAHDASPGTEQGPETYTLLPPRAFFISSCDDGCAPLQLTFTNLSSEAIEYTWSFGDGGKSSENNPSYIFDDAGEHFVTLTARNENDEISVHSNLITVHAVPEASFMIDKQDGMAEDIPVYFYNYSKGADNYLWDFGDGTQSYESNPSHVYAALDNYDILLQATSFEGCIDTMILSNALHGENPIIRIPNAFCPNTGGPNGGYYGNGENSNEVFHPVFEEPPVEYQLRIFNRNGNLLFESNDLNLGWDGYFMQELQPRGVYIYKLRAKYENGEYIVKMGDVTIYMQD